MRIISFIISTLITAALAFFFDRSWSLAGTRLPPLGRFLSPQQGIWQNAEPAQHNFSEDFQLEGLKGKVRVYLDERLVPHIFAEQDEDLYFVQGYLHARFRLWQMEFQSRAAAGRLSELLGNEERIVNYDRETRRMGMVYAAEKALAEIEGNPISKSGCDAYTAGVNAYIETLTYAELPVEYKLLDCRPEKWSNLKIALFLKQMSRTLAGFDHDLAFTNLKSKFSFEELLQLNPQIPDSLRPVVPAGTAFDPPGVVPVAPSSADSIYFGKRDSMHIAPIAPSDPTNGSNNWAVAGSRTRSGSPILCNDPHLELTFPSIWFEVQLSSPSVNAYGASFPGSPNVIIGFNDSIAFGFTNAQRDVKDYYEIRFRDSSRREYWFDGKWVKTTLREEKIRVRGGKDVLDTVAYTVFGPVLYDHRFSPEAARGRTIALRWVAHDPSNDGLMWFHLDRAKNYDDYYRAIQSFACPGQNILFASRSGDIAIWQQGRFPARWFGQGLFVMPGEDSSFMWQGFIPQAENPHVINPPSGYIVSANQRPADSSYPYFIPGNYITTRAITINRELSAMQNITVADMQRLQNNYYNTFASEALPLLLNNVDEAEVHEGRKFLELLRSWDLNAGPDSKGQTVFKHWWDSLHVYIWRDDMQQVPQNKYMPDSRTTLEALLRDSAFIYIDDRRTPETEDLGHAVTHAFRMALPQLIRDEGSGRLEWAKNKRPAVYHVLKNISALARQDLPVGGDGNIINAVTKSHGPSWRMIVHLARETEAYAIYPGGQSGNPGSRYYDNFLDPWTRGEYFRLWMMKATENKDPRVRWEMQFAPRETR